MAKLECFEHNASNSNRSFKKRAMSWMREENYKTNYFQKIDSSNSEMLKYKEQLEECAKEKKLLADKIIGLEREINDLQKNHGGRISGA